MKTKVITLISALFLSCLAAFADVDTGIYLSKNAIYDYATQTGTLKLESFVGQVTKEINLDESSDVILIVDGSNSMGTDGMNSLCAAVDAFASQLKSSPTGPEHRMSLIIYSGHPKLLTNYTAVSGLSDNFFSGKIKDACGTDGSGNCKVFGTGTTTHVALGLAYYLLTNDVSAIYTSSDNNLPGSVNGHTGVGCAINQNWTTIWDANTSVVGAISAPRTTDSRGKNVNHYVVLMTDGAVSGDVDAMVGGTVSIGGGHHLDHNSGEPDYRVYAKNEAVAAANLIKAAGATIYSIGFLNSSDETRDINTFLNSVSSNYLAPTSYTEKKDYLPHDYYIKVTKTSASTTTLSQVFAHVSEEIVAGCAAVDLTSATVKDVINGGSFKLPASVNASNLGSHIKAYTVPCKECTYDYTDGWQYKFDDTDPSDVTGLTFGLAYEPVGSDNAAITVSGFDFDNNWCGNAIEDPDPATNLKTIPHGNKLVIEIPIIVNSYDNYLGNVPTNLTGSSFLGEKPDATLLTQEYPVPALDLYELTISRTGLKAGESVIYKVTDKDDNLIYTVALTGTGSGAISQKLLYVPAGNVTVTEQTGWGWANTPTPDDITIEIGTPTTEKPLLKPNPTYSFSGTPTGDKNPEDHNDNRFK